MIRYVAFLRAINLAGQKLIKMERLAQILQSMGFKNVHTYIQSGNVIFDASVRKLADFSHAAESPVERKKR